MTTTTKELIARHNTLSMSLGRPELTGWKQSKEALAERVDAMEACLAQDADAADDALRAEAEAFVAERMTDPLALPLETSEGETGFWTQTDDGPVWTTVDTVADEEPSAVEPDEAEVLAAEATTDEHSDETEHPGKIGAMIADLLVDPEGYDYQEIVDIVKGRFPQAKTSRRSIASVAAALRRKAIEVPMRRKARKS